MKVILLFILGSSVTLGQVTTKEFGSAGSNAAPTFPLKRSVDNRYLAYQDGTPFFMNGDAAWSLMSNVNFTEAKVYLDNRASLGFNTIMVSLIEKYYTSWPESNKDGNPCFTGARFATPNEAYFVNCDSVIRYATNLGMVVLLAPAYLGANDADGWRTDVAAASLTTMYQYGRYIGSRYRDFDNIVWMPGGDTDPTPWAARIDTMCDGIRSTDINAVFTLHGASDNAMAIDYSLDKWVDFNNVYTYQPTHPISRTAYRRNPVLPFFMLESQYETGIAGGPFDAYQTDAQGTRIQAYSAVLFGARGHIFGNYPLWWFLPGWNTPSGMGSLGSNGMKHFRDIVTSRPWYRLIPDTASSIVTSGAGSYSSETYALSAFDSDGSYQITYLPTSRQVTINGNRTNKDSILYKWFNPVTGDSILIGVRGKGPQVITPPAAQDWILIGDAVDGGGSAGLGESGVEPSDFTLFHTYPNPFNPTTTIVYDLPRVSFVRLLVYDTSGRLVRTLVNRREDAGRYSEVWNGTDEANERVASGIYYCRLMVSGQSLIRKMLLIR